MTGPSWFFVKRVGLCIQYLFVLCGLWSFMKRAGLKVHCIPHRTFCRRMIYFVALPRTPYALPTQVYDHMTRSNWGMVRILWGIEGDGPGLLHYALPHQEVGKYLCLWCVHNDLHRNRQSHEPPYSKRWGPVYHISDCSTNDLVLGKVLYQPVHTHQKIRCLSIMPSSLFTVWTRRPWPPELRGVAYTWAAPRRETCSWWQGGLGRWSKRICLILSGSQACLASPASLKGEKLMHGKVKLAGKAGVDWCEKLAR